MTVTDGMYRSLLDSESNKPTSLFPTLIGVFLILIVFYAGTVGSIVSVWWYSETFSHGFLIVPICILLILRVPKRIYSVNSPPSLWPMLLVIPVGVIWLLAHLVGVQVIEQLSFVLISILTCWSVLGNARSRVLWFPLMFLLFAAPVGDELVPVLMKITADYTVSLISLSGIPVFREGLYFSLPSGNWSVVEACSGIRYLIASLTMGVLYAYLNFTSTTARILFIFMSAAVPIVANVFRAFGIVMMGHFSGMEMATGVDHLVYGWLFFGFIMFLLFSFGKILKNYFESEQTTTLDDIKVSISVRSGAGSDEISALTKLLVIAGVVMFWPVFAKITEANVSELSEIDIMKSVSAQILDGDEWRLRQNTGGGWQPDYSGYDATESVLFSNNESSNSESSNVEVQLLTYQHQHQGKELIRNQNVLSQGNSDHWKIVSTRVVEANLGGESIEVLESVLKSKEKSIIVWHWYVIDGKITIAKLHGKLLEAKNKILMNEKPSFAFFMVVENVTDTSLLEAYFEKNYPLFQSAIIDKLSVGKL